MLILTRWRQLITDTVKIRAVLLLVILSSRVHSWIVCPFQAPSTLHHCVIRRATQQQRQQQQLLQRSLSVTSDKNSADQHIDNDSDGNDQLPVVASDAEALLACRSYLRKRKMLGGWTQQQRRQFLQQQQQEITSSSSSFTTATTSFSVYHQPDDRLSETIQDDDDILNSGDDSMESAVPSMRASIPFEQNVMFGPTPTLEWAESFISAPVAPSVTHQRRSQAALKRWQQPEWKEFWYQRRWGNKPKLSSSSSSLSSTSSSSSSSRTLEQQQRQEQQQIRRIQKFQLQLMNTNNLEEFLALDDWDTMSQADMEQAIRTYISSNQNRVLSRQATLLGRKEALRQNWDQVTTAALATTLDNQSNTTTTAKRNTTWQPPTKEALREARKERSERSRRIYQKRLENEQLQQQQQQQQQPARWLQTASKQSRQVSTIPAIPLTIQRHGGHSPQDAMMRIKELLQRHPQRIPLSTTSSTAATPSAFPSIADVQLILAPGKLAGRKELLRDVLSQCFQLRGKCVPPIAILSQLLERGETEQHPPGRRRSKEQQQGSIDHCLFVTQCTVDHLGKFVLYLLTLQQQQQPTAKVAESTPAAAGIRPKPKQRTERSP